MANKLRYQSRHEKRKQNRMLNIAIGIVVILILIVGTSIFLGGNNDSATDNSHKNVTTATSPREKDKSKDDFVVDEGKKKEEKSDKSTDDKKSKDEKEKSKDEVKGGGPEGPWEPIGTSQKEPHTKSYDMNSEDWKEMTKALSYASGISESDMTILWLGNGGGPDKSLGRVKSKSDPSKKYTIMLQWVPEKGWQPTSVEPLQ
ncbi:YrrS family protein [Fictibacillus sp. Mic-4]|uniref:YrrS family protein n=1 Tax=Fictibacillus sp. Mic-4 TaxID=3132826 RepID=UPI003CF9A0F9